MNWKKCRNLLLLSCCLGGMQPAAAQRDTLFLPVDRLFELGLKHSLQLQADALEEKPPGSGNRGPGPTACRTSRSACAADSSDSP